MDYWMMGRSASRDFFDFSPLYCSSLFIIVPIDTANHLEGTADEKVISYSRLYET